MYLKFCELKENVKSKNLSIENIIGYVIYKY